MCKGTDVLADLVDRTRALSLSLSLSLLLYSPPARPPAIALSRYHADHDLASRQSQSRYEGNDRDLTSLGTGAGGCKSAYLAPVPLPRSWRRDIERRVIVAPCARESDTDVFRTMARRTLRVARRIRGRSFRAPPPPRRRATPTPPSFLLVAAAAEASTACDGSRNLRRSGLRSFNL